MATKSFCDMCEKEILEPPPIIGGKFRILLSPYTSRQMLCRKCIIEVVREMLGRSSAS